MTIRVGILGASGRMGRSVEEVIGQEFRDQATVHARSSSGEDLAPLLATELVIDFSLPAGMLALTQEALKKPDPLPVFIVGSTGWKLDERRQLETLAQRTAVLMSSNFSTGVLVMTELLKKAAPLLEKLGYSAAIVETHHVHKLDAPSGTAASLQRAIAPAGPGNVPVHSIRAGEVIGDHEVTFFGKGDRLRFSHLAQDRTIFARGAVQCGLWLAARRGSGLIGIEKYFEALSTAK
jgi:4-hydroxy-tetrahydrodipicolinate reductase